MNGQINITQIRIKQTIHILHALEKNQVSFVVLRNYEFLQGNETIDAPGDIDILIRKHDQSKCFSILQKNGFIGQKTLNHYGFFHVSNEAIALDIQVDDICERNIPYLSYSQLTTSIKKIDGIPVLSGSHLLIHLVVHCLINKGTFKNEYRTLINTLLLSSENRTELLHFLTRFFNRSKANTILKNLLHNSFGKLSHKRDWFVLHHLFTNKPALGPYSTFLRYKLFKKAPFKGQIIAIIGLDGTGKTTLANAIIDLLKKRHVPSLYLYMGRKRGHALPMHAISTKVGMSQLKKKGKGPNILYRFARDGMYVLDMFSRYVKFILPHIYKNRTVVCDRYAYSLYLDKNQTLVSRLLLRLLYPKPDILVFIDTPEQEIIRRKDEYSKEERRFLLDRWKQVIKDFSAYVIASQDLQKMVALVLNRLWLSKPKSG